MDALESLSKSATVTFWYISVVATFAFGAVFLFGWLSEEFATSDKWKARKKWLIIAAIVGVAGEQLATIGEFVFSEHFKEIDDAQINPINCDGQWDFYRRRTFYFAAVFKKCTQRACVRSAEIL